MSRFFRQLSRSLKQAANTEWRKSNGKRDWKYELFELKWAFMDTFIHSWLTPLIVIQESTARIIKWLPILWKDRDWDHNYILEIFKTKIRFTRENIEKYGHHVNSDVDCQRMRIAELLIERLQDSSKYTEKEWEEHFAIYPSWRERMFKDEKGNSVITAPGEEESKHSKRIFDKEEYMWQQDFKYLSNHLRKYLRSWWD